MINPKRFEQIKNQLEKKYPLFEFLGTGMRSEVYRLNKNLVVKIERDDTDSKDRIKNEYDTLNILKKYKYFPKPFDYNPKLKYLIRDYVGGDLIKDVFDKEIFINCLKLCRCLDTEGINQSELNNPYKHIFIAKDKIMMIDFERARKMKNPHNVSQFIAYIMKKYRIKDDILINLVKEYKKKYDEASFKRILERITSF
ncbi:Uncharacterised protein [Candidatus Tiddalikarchaeum anstoanum]|nr:Uncharacterised protein [Candidatus Tiddalikarchaeum anstoanum]